MNRIIISGNHIEISDSIKDFIMMKSSPVLKRYDDIIRVRVELNLESGKASEKRFVTRVLVELRGPDIVAVSISDNAYASLDATLRKAERQLRHRVRLARFKREQVINRMRPSLTPSTSLQKLAFT